MIVDYSSLVTLTQRTQQTVVQKYEAIARQFDNAREQVVRKLMEENSKAMNLLASNRNIKNEDKTDLITKLQTAFTTALNEVQTLGMTTQNDLRSNSMKSNSEDLTKLMATVKDLQTAQGKALETVMKTITEVPTKLNAQWATVETVVNEIASKAK